MSRCMPFPPPGYVWNGVGGDALVRLLEEKRKRDVKAEKKRKKEERKRRKKLLEEIEDLEEGEIREENSPYGRGGHESSGLTEEHDQPITHSIRKVKRAKAKHGCTSNENSPAIEDQEITSKSIHKNNISMDELRYRELIVSWIPPPMQTEHPESDQMEWLFKTKPPGSPKRSSCSEYAYCGRPSSLYPSASYLPHADVNALPFTVPF